MARKQGQVKSAVGRKPVRTVEPDEPTREFVSILARACKVCEARAALTKFSHIAFQRGRFQATDGVVQVQGRSIFPVESSFSLSEAKLAQALALIDPVDKVTESAEFVKFVRGPLSVRVRKLDADLAFFDPFKMTKSAKKADGLLAALKKVEPFMSEDATRPWSVSVLLMDGYAIATNNLALVRSPLPAIFKEPISIPFPAVKQLCTLETLDYIEETENKNIAVASGKMLYRFPAGAAGWPDLKKFFDKMPKKMPALPAEMSNAAHAGAQLSDRFVTVGSNRVDAKSESLDATYEVDLAKGSGVFSARLLALIAQVATHAEFSFFPEPIFFRGEGIEGTAVGARQA